MDIPSFPGLINQIRLFLYNFGSFIFQYKKTVFHTSGWIFGKFQKAHGEGLEKMHSMFHCDQTNASWFRFGETNFGSPVHAREGVKFLENSKKHLWGTTKRKRIASYIVIIWMEVWFKIGGTNNWKRRTWTHSSGHFRSAVTFFPRQISKFCNKVKPPSFV